MNAKQRRQAKRHPDKGVRHNPKKVGHPPKIGVEKGRGPRHADNSMEGMPVDLTKIDTDTVDAKLTPREAVLNRNASELAGRDNIEALNQRGNELAKKGVDLAGGETMQSKPKHLQGGDDAVQRNPFPGRGPGGVYPGGGVMGQPGGEGLQPYGDGPFPGRPPGGVYGGLGGPFVGGGGPVAGVPSTQMPGFGGGLGARDEFGRQFSQRNEQGGFGRGHGVPGAPDPRGSGPFGTPPAYGGYPAEVPQPMPYAPPQTWRQMPSQPFYPPGQGLKMAEGESDILGGGESIYGKAAPVELSAPSGLGAIVAALKAEAAKQGISPSQVQGLLKAFGGAGGGGSGLTVGAGTGNMDAVGAFQGGISEVGYPPLISPNADFSYDRGGWVGAYDPRYSFPSY